MHPSLRPALRARIAAPLAALALFFSGCARDRANADGKEAADGEKSDDPVPVEIVKLERGPLESVLRFSVNLEAERQVQVLARAAGQVETLRVEEGDRVKKGEVLLRMQDEEQKSQLAKAQHDLDRARREHAKQEEMHERGLVSDQQLETAAYEEKRLELAVADARRAVRYTVVRATIGGTVSKRMVKLGDFVSVQQPLFQITDFDSIVARVFVPEKEMAKLEEEMSARILPQGSGGNARQGEVDRIAPVIDPASGTVKVTIAIGDPEGLRPGMFVDVELVTGRKEGALRLPKRALVYEGEQPYAFKLTGDKVERVRVEPAIQDRSFVEPASGFSAGDRVVVAGQVGLKDGALVEARPARGGGVEAAARAKVDETDASQSKKRVQ